MLWPVFVGSHGGLEACYHVFVRLIFESDIETASFL